MVVREPRIRSELLADKEKRSNSRSLAMQEQWGFYRPVNDKSADELSAVLNLTIPDIKRYLKQKRRQGAPIEVQDDFGVTFVKRRDVGRKMFQAIAGGFRMAHAVDELSQTARCIQEPLEIELDWEKFAWYMNSERKAVTKFADSRELERLEEEKTIIEEILGEHGLKGVVSKPDHLTLFTYGVPRDNMSLTPHYKKEVLRIVRQRFDDEGLESVSLDRLNIGPSYTEPCNHWEQVCS